MSRCVCFVLIVLNFMVLSYGNVFALLSAGAHHVCTVSFHLPRPSEDLPLQPLLSSCQALEVIPSLRPFLFLLLLLLRRFEAAYVKCVKMLFGFARRDSVTAMFYELGLPTFKTIIHNAKVKMDSCLKVHSNVLIRSACAMFCCVCVISVFYFCCFFTSFYAMFFCMYV